MANVIINDTHLTDIANAIREKNGLTDKYKPSEMAMAISAIESGGGEGGNLNDYIPEEAFVITGNCKYRFTYDYFNWFVKMYEDKIVTENITDASSMFYYCTLSEIPFNINLSEETKGTPASSVFSFSDIQKAPYIVGKPNAMNNLFYQTKYLAEIPEDWADYIDWSYMQSQTSNMFANSFYNCYSLKKIPESIVVNMNNPFTSQSACPFYYSFYDCYVLEEIKGLKQTISKWTTNMFTQFTKLGRLKTFTFATQEDGTPYAVSWKNQTLTLSNYHGWINSPTNIINYSNYHGITADKYVKDDATYQTLKDDPDWWTTNSSYSRYNHDSAVNTINSLPDTSEYLASAGGTNTIKFKGTAGSATDGGAINTLTEEEIAVATAKGWTVSLV